MQQSATIIAFTADTKQSMEGDTGETRDNADEGPQMAVGSEKVKRKDGEGSRCFRRRKV